IGSFVVSMLADSMLGSVPAVQGSRLRTLLSKWALIVLLALATSGVYVLIANRLGMPIQHTLSLWLFGALAIAAVGITSTSLIAVLGSLGLLISLFVFVILGLPSVGAIVPLEATPQFFAWLATFEPMHQVYLGARAILYFDGRADAGLSEAVELTVVGLVIGLLLGAIVTRFYDRRGEHPTPSEPAGSPAVPAQSSAETAATAPTSETITDTTEADE
ncbi:MAG: DUF3533 domain-containing protein, partial [Mycobacterium sp.]|nr:DUF3533 domain-containing protein [Mycobacterium sp.]